MSIVPFPIIKGVDNACIGESFVTARYFDDDCPSWKEIAEGAQIQAERYAKHLAIANRAYDELAASYATLQRRNRELEKRDLGIAEVLMSFVNLFKKERQV